MRLPGNPYDSVLILARKDLFRAFLKDNGFNVPKSESFYSLLDAKVWLGYKDSSGSVVFFRNLQAPV